jgi:hypothetical protein
MLKAEVVLMFLPVFFVFFGIGAVAGIVYVTIKYLIPLILYCFVSIFEVLKTWKNAFMEGWRGDGK